MKKHQFFFFRLDKNSGYYLQDSISWDSTSGSSTGSKREAGSPSGVRLPHWHAYSRGLSASVRIHLTKERAICFHDLFFLTSAKRKIKRILHDDKLITFQILTWYVILWWRRMWLGSHLILNFWVSKLWSQGTNSHSRDILGLILLMSLVALSVLSLPGGRYPALRRVASGQCFDSSSLMHQWSTSILH